VDVDLMRYLGFAVNDCLYRLHWFVPCWLACLTHF
jgi:hypothetical protein